MNTDPKLCFPGPNTKLSSRIRNFSDQIRELSDKIRNLSNRIRNYAGLSPNLSDLRCLIRKFPGWVRNFFGPGHESAGSSWKCRSVLNGDQEWKWRNYRDSFNFTFSSGSLLAFMWLKLKFIGLLRVEMTVSNPQRCVAGTFLGATLLVFLPSFPKRGSECALQINWTFFKGR
jgi:hypothetical protein